MKTYFMAVFLQTGFVANREIIGTKNEIFDNFFAPPSFV
jgi:hypothetical protein